MIEIPHKRLKTIMSRQGKIRVLIVDDSYFIRKLLSEIFVSEKDIEVVGEARDGEEAIREVKRLQPDVMTMDYNMPKMTGAEAIEKIMRRAKVKPAIIMISAYTKEGADETLESLRAGAVDFITKPSGEISLDLAKIRQEILAKVRGAASARIRIYPERGKAPSGKRISKMAASKVVTIGASTGGPPVIEEILSHLPSDFPAALVIAQHMPKYFTQRFAKRLNILAALKIKEAEDGDVLWQGTALIAPGDYRQTQIQDFWAKTDPETRDSEESGSRYIIALSQDSPQEALAPSIDALMTSAARAAGEDTIGILLTGMGEDGLRGMHEIKEMGGYTIVQEPDTAVIDSMPCGIIQAGIADDILSPEEMAKALIKLCQTPAEETFHG